MPSGKTKTLREAAIEVLERLGPTHYRELTSEILRSGLATTSSKSPSTSLNVTINVDIKRKGVKSKFIRVSPGVFGLRALHGRASASTDGSNAGTASLKVDELVTDADESEQRVRISNFPIYRVVRLLLQLWNGRPRRQIRGLRNALWSRRVQRKALDWTNPDAWIRERLSGDSRVLAEEIWSGSNRTVNPRYTYGPWLLSQTYGLVDSDRKDLVRVTNRGWDFIKNEGGTIESLLDEREGLTRILALVADNGPVRSKEMLGEWAEYLQRHSNFGTQSVFKHTLAQRLNNLIDRDLVNRKSTMYTVTDAGLEHLKRVGAEESFGGGEQQEIWELAKKQEVSVRENLLELLLDMDPYVFEHLVKRLLEEMNYQNVQVTTRSGDGGVDVVADIELGITSVREVVQAKRHRQNIQRKDLDALRGSLYRFNAVRGTIISTSRFSKGTQEAAFAGGAAPITLIDGEKLVDLLIEHNIGVRKRALEILEVDADGLVDLEAENE